MEGKTDEAVQVKRRRHLDESAWREVIGRFPVSRLTLEEFCRREGVCTTSFRRWRAKLAGAANPLPAARPAVRAAQDLAFIDLGDLGADSARQALELRLDLGGGVSLHLVRA